MEPMMEPSKAPTTLKDKPHLTPNQMSVTMMSRKAITVTRPVNRSPKWKDAHLILNVNHPLGV
jgi:hypothetical protein